jgi:Domain of unknown function (DUF5666)
MSAIPYDSQTQEWDPPEQDEPTTPGRRRRRWLNRKSAALAAAITCAVGFYAGIRVEKGQLASPATAATTATGSGAAGTGAAGAGAGARAGFLGAARGAGGANASIGTVSSVDGNTIYLTDTSGDTVKVTLSSATKVTKNQSVSKTSIRPGDAVVIQGLKGSSGTITATSVSDSGASTARAGAGTAGGGTTTSTTGTTG